jgi:hypothetical protein
VSFGSGTIAAGEPLGLGVDEAIALGLVDAALELGDEDELA